MRGERKGKRVNKKGAREKRIRERRRPNSITKKKKKVKLHKNRIFKFTISTRSFTLDSAPVSFTGSQLMTYIVPVGTNTYKHTVSEMTTS